MKILILGWDGYIGYPLTQHLLGRGHEIFGIDNFSRRHRVEEAGSNSLTPIADGDIRKYKIGIGDLSRRSYTTLGRCSPTYIRSILSDFKPDAIVHLAEQPSAAWSMKDPFHAGTTQYENVIGTLHLLWAMKEECPEAHLIKLGTMGEYGTPACDIPEGEIPYSCLHKGKFAISCPMSGLLFPRTPGSFYHLSKVHDTYNIEFACRNWGLRSTDIMQGVVFGLNETNDESLLTRFDYDEFFGTAINRFCIQAIIEHPLTVYGKGNQQRGFLPLKDSIQCLTLAIDNPPEHGEYRTFNQFENIYSINKLANMVAHSATELNLDPSISHIKPNPRLENEDHYYNPTCQKLFNLGYQPTTDIQGEITKLIKTILPYKDRVIKEVIMPKVNWR